MKSSLSVRQTHYFWDVLEHVSMNSNVSAICHRYKQSEHLNLKKYSAFPKIFMAFYLPLSSIYLLNLLEGNKSYFFSFKNVL